MAYELLLSNHKNNSDGTYESYVPSPLYSAWGQPKGQKKMKRLAGLPSGVFYPRGAELNTNGD